MNVYDIVTGKIMDCLNEGVVPWQKNWTKSVYANYTTQKAYRGINQLLLTAQCVIKKADYSSPYWLTWKQIQNLKGSIKKGEKASIIVFYDSKIIEEESTNEKNEKEIKKKKISFLKYYHVFNWHQTENIPEIVTSRNETKKSCEEIMESMQEKPVIKRGGQPAYSPKEDAVIMPHINDFQSSDAYYAALFHELVHWTGHGSRLDRFTDESLNFASVVYSKEELVAELGSSFLCHIAGIEKDVIKNQAAYIQGWLNALHNDKRLIIQASGQAGKSVDFILSKSEEKALLKTA